VPEDTALVQADRGSRWLPGRSRRRRSKGTGCRGDPGCWRATAVRGGYPLARRRAPDGK